MFCTKCGFKPEDADALFCAECGNKIERILIARKPQVMPDMRRPQTLPVERRPQALPIAGRPQAMPAAKNSHIKKLIIAFAALGLIAVLGGIAWSQLSPLGGGDGLSGTWALEGTSGEPYIVFRGNNFTTAYYFTHFYRRFETTSSTVFGGWFGGFYDEMDLLEEGDGFRHFRVIRRGTYSITDNRVELIFSNGEVLVSTFIQTENTLRFEGGPQLIRR